MQSIRLKNLRSLKDTGEIKIKGLTVIVGENSVGKSTIIRSLPLIKQSIETQTTTPLLWYGNYVDFGSFKESLCRECEEERIIFSFSLTISLDSRNRNYYFPIKRVKGGQNNVNIELCIKGKDKDKSDYINKIRLKIIDNSIELDIDIKGKVTGMSVNGREFTDLVKDYTFVNPRLGIIPKLTYERYYNSIEEYFSFFEDDIENTFINKLRELISTNVHKNTSEKKIYDIIKKFNINSKNKFKSNILRNSLILESWNKSLRDENSDELIEEIRDLYIASRLRELLDRISNELNTFSQNSYYIAPVRANANRYYRNQNLAVDYVDFQGINLPMLLANLSKKQQDEFSDWINENFGFEVFVKTSEGHISINIKRNNEVVNMVDCGFGYSQILPIITQLWLLTKRKVPDMDLTLLIEQPELHLHPKMQGSLIDAFIKCIKIKDSNINIVIETHSESIINRIGYLISSQEISTDDVNLYILKKNYNNETVVDIGRYDNEGYLENWPIDFFNVEEL